LNLESDISKSYVIGTRGIYKQVADKAVECLLDASTVDALLYFISEYCDPNFAGQADVADLITLYGDVRKIMIETIEAKAFIDGLSHDKLEFEKVLGIRWGTLNLTDEDPETAQAKAIMPLMDESYMKRNLSPISEGKLKALAEGDPFSFERALRIKADYEKSASFGYMGIESRIYHDFIYDGILSQHLNRRTIDLIEIPNSDFWILVYPGSSYENSDYGRIEWASDFINIVTTLHLHDVRTLYENGIFYQTCNSSISSLWVCLAGKLSRGRTLKCKACGKPIITTSERGNPRQYCDDACRKWAERNPGETRFSSWQKQREDQRGKSNG